MVHILPQRNTFFGQNEAGKRNWCPSSKQSNWYAEYINTVGTGSNYY